MADAEARIGIDVDVSNALAGLRTLQKEIARFNLEMAKGTAAQRAQAASLQKDLINNINASGKFAASIKTVSTSAESFTNALEKNKLSMGQYFKYAAGTSKSFSRLFRNEFDTIEKVARERVKTLQTQYIKLGRDASGAMKAIAIRPLALDMDNLATKTAMAAQKQAILNQLLRQGSTNLLNFGKNTQWAGRQLMVGFTIPLTIFGAAAAKSFMQMEEQAIKFRRVYGDTFTASEETEKMIKQVKELASEFTKYGVQVEKTMAMAADAAAMGQMGADLLAQIKESTKLAVLGGVEQEEALETTISLTNAFGVAAEDLASKIDFLNAVENQTVTAIEDLTIAIPKAAPVIKQLGGNVEDLAFFLTAMKEGGINASEGANALKSGLASLINPAQKSKDMLAEFGINIDKIVESNAGNVKGLVIEFANALDQLDPLSRARAIEQLFGKFQFSRISTLFQNVVKEGTQAERVLKLSASSAAELRVLTQRELKRVEDSPMFKFQKAVEDLQVSLAPLGEAFIKAVTPLIKFGTDLLNNFNKLDDGTKNIIVTLGGLLGVVGPVALMTFGLLANGVANLIKLFVTMGGIFSKSKLGTQDLATSTQYLTQEQLEADAVAASLNSKHIALTNTFSSEAAAINNLVVAYNRALTAQGRLLGTTSARGRVVPGMQLSRGIESVPGPRGAGDVVPAMLSPGEAVIPARQSEKYGSLISAIMKDQVPGFRFGRFGAAKKFKSDFGRGIVPKTSNWSFAEGLIRTITGQRGVFGRSTTEFENKYRNRALLKPGRRGVAVRMHSDDFVASLARGDKRYKNIFETGGKSRGSLDEGTATGQRAIAEQRLFGISPNADPRTRPAYGYIFNRDLPQIKYGRTSIADRLFNQGRADVNARKFSAQDSISQSMALMNPKTYRYGDIAMVLRNRALRGRTTQVTGDSINARLDQYAVPAKFGTRNRKALAASTSSGKGSSEFIEAQILGGFRYKDIKRIVSTNPETIIALQTALKAAGIRGIRVGMPKMTMMQRIKSALKLGPAYPTRFPRIQSEGPYAGRYHDDPIDINGRKLWLNKGIVSVPGPKGAGDIIPAMLSPGEAVIPAKIAKKYAPIIQALVSNSIPGFMAGVADAAKPKTIQLPLSTTLQAGHFADPAVSGQVTGTQAADLTSKKLAQLLKMGVIDESMIDRKALQNLRGNKAMLNPLSNTVGFMTSELNQRYTNAKSTESAANVRKMMSGTRGMAASGTLANLEYLQKFGKAGAVSDTAFKGYMDNLYKNIDKSLKQLGDKQLSAKQLNKVYKDATIEAEKTVSKLSERSAIKRANALGRLFPAFAQPGSGGSGRSNIPVNQVALKGYSSAQKMSATPAIRSKIERLAGTSGKFLAQSSIRPDLKPNAPAQNLTNLLRGIQDPDGQIRASKDVIAAKGNPKKLDKIAKDIQAGKYGTFAVAKKQATKKSVPSRPKTPTSNKPAVAKPAPASKTKPTSNIISRENIGNGVQRTVSQSSTGKILTSYFLNGKRISETKALEQAQLKTAGGAPKTGRPSLGTAMGTVGGVGMTAGMMMSFSGDDQMASIGQNVMMGGLLLSMLPMLKNPVVAILASVAAAAGGLIYLNNQLKESAKAGVEAANGMSMTSEKLESMAEFTGTVSASNIARDARTAQLTGEDGKKRQFGQTFLESEAGQSMLNDVKAQIERGGDLDVSSNVANQLAYAVLQGVLEKSEAASIAAALSAELQDFSITAKVNGQLNRLMGPNGENLLTDPLTIALNIQEDSVDQQLIAYENALGEIEANTKNNLASSAGMVAGSLMTAAGVVAAIGTATGVGAPLGYIASGVLALAGGVSAAIGVIAEFQDAAENAEAAGVAVQLGAEQLAQGQGLLDSIERRYDSQIAELEAKKELAKTDEEILAIENEISSKQGERELALEKIKTKNSAIYDSLVAQAKELGPAFDQSINASIDSRFKDSSDALKAAVNLAKDNLSDMEDGDFKIALQLGLASGEFDPITITNLINANANTGGQIEAKFNMIVDAEGTAAANQLIQLLAKAGVQTANYPVVIDYVMNNKTEFDNDLEALAQIGNMPTEYGLVIDINGPNGENVVNSVSQFIEDTEAMPDKVSLDVLTNYLAAYPNMDPQTIEIIKGLIDNWDVLSAGNNEVNYQVLVDFAIGKADPAAILAFYLSQNPDKAPKFTGSIDALDRQKSSLVDDATAWFMGLLGQNSAIDVEETVDPPSTGTRNTVLDGILNKLKQVRDASINATGGIKELLRVLGSGKTLNDFVGFDQQLVFKGYGPEFIDFLNGLDSADRGKFLTIENGIIKVTAAGKALNKAFAEAALGEFQFSLVQGISNINMSITAMNKLTAAGLSNADAYEIASNAALAYAIATATTDEEIQKIIDKFRILKNLQTGFDMSTVDGLLSATGTAFSAIQEYFNNRKALVQFDFETGLNQSGLNELGLSIDTIQETIAASSIKIFEWENDIDDLEYLLDGIQEQEDLINETYDKRIDALEKTNDLNKAAMALEKQKLSVADALSSGDIAAAARAAQEYREQQAEQQFEKQKESLELGRERALAAVVATNGKTRKELEKEILDLKKQIVVEEENVLEPAQEALTLAERARDVAISMVENEDYLGKNEKEWRAIELAIKDTVTKTDEWRQKIIDVFKLIPGFKEILDEDGNVIGFEFDPSVFQSWIDSLFNGIRTAVQNGVDDLIGEEIVVDDDQVNVVDTPGGNGGNGDTGSGAIPESEAVVGGIDGLLNNGPVIADITPGELEELPIILDEDDLAARMPDNPLLADPTPGEMVELPLINIEDLEDNMPDNPLLAAPTPDEVYVPPPPKKPPKLGGGPGKWIHFASGGLIPRMASGGLFKSINTDTVPAMLSPGEFVVKRHSVSKYGTDMLKSINGGTYSGDSVYNYSVSVNVKSDANPDEIARTVMAQIKRVDAQRIRSNRF